MKQLQVLILGFLKNSEFFHLKKKSQEKPLDMFINMKISLAIVGFLILISVLYMLPLIL